MDPVALALLAVVAVAVGFFIGTVGVGGVLLIPALVLLGGLDIHVASATGSSRSCSPPAGHLLFYNRRVDGLAYRPPVCVASGGVQLLARW